MSKKFLVDIDLQQNELKGAVIENLATAPANPKPGQHYFSTVDNTEYFWDGTKWVNGSGDFTFTNGIEQDGRNVQIAVATGAHAGNVVFTADTNGLAASVDLSGKVDKLSTKPTAGDYTKVTINSEGQVTSGTTLSESDIPSLHLAKVTDVTATAAEVNKLAGLATTATELGYVHGVTSAIQTQLNGKVDALASGPTAGDYTKVTVTADGLVSAGTTLSESDIPSLHLAKITDVTASAAEVNVLDGITASTAELNILDGVTADASELNILDGATLTTTELNYVDGVTSSIQDQLNDKLELDSLSVAATSADYMAYDNTSGEFSLSVDTTPTADSTSLITSGGVKSYVDGKISTTYKAAGSVAFANLPTLGSTYEGYVYNVTDAFTTTADFVEGAGNDYPAGTNVVCINTATSGTAVYKWDVLAGFVDVSDFITATSTDTLENKTISADDNTISDLTTSNLKSGVLQTTVRATTSASDTALASEKAIAAALDGKQDLIASPTANNIVTVDGNGQVLDSEKAFVTAIGPATGASAATDAEIPTAKATRTLVDSAISAGKATITNGALTPDANNVCTWSITGLAGDPYSIVILDNSGNEVIADIAYGTKSATIKMNSASTISADSFSAKILM